MTIVTTSLSYYTQYKQYEMRQQMHVQTIIQVLCCWIQTEMWKKIQKTN